MYTGDELRQIIYGFDKDVFDIDDMKNNIQYLHWNMNDPKEIETITNFFKIVHEFDIKEKEKLLTKIEVMQEITSITTNKENSE